MAFSNLKDSTALYRLQTLTAKEKLVGAVLLSFRNADTGLCNPPVKSSTVESICSRSSLTDRTVQAALAGLRDKGVLTIALRNNQPSLYSFNLPQDDCPEEISPRTDFAPKNIRPEKSSDYPEEISGSPRKDFGLPRKIFGQTDKEQIRTDKEQIVVGDFALTPPEKTEPKKRTMQPKPVTHEFNLTALPDEWRELCKKIRPDIDPDRSFENFKFYWTEGRGKGTRRSAKGWATTWQNWIKKEYETRTPNRSAFKPTTNYEDVDYDMGINPDGTF